MRIGILTFHRAHNYGAVLQCYALQQVLLALGHSVDVIDYRQPFIEKVYKTVSIKRIMSKNPLKIIIRIINEFRLLKIRNEKKELYVHFLNSKLKLNRVPINNIKEMPEDYDVYIFGSDQIWNSKLTGGVDRIFWGEFETSNNANKVAYAASTNLSNIDEIGLSKISKLLKNFNHIGVREISIADKLQPYSKNPIKAVLDPTLLINSDKWSSISKSIKCSKRYVLLYEVRKSNSKPEAANKIANKIAKEMGGVVIDIHKGYDEIKSFSPEEFIGLFENASYIVTSSFHATAFSIIFRKNFYALALKDGHDSRYEVLLNNIGLSDRLVSINFDNPEVDQDIDYSQVYLKLNKLKEDSMSYLKNAICSQS